ncbi:MAG: bifunctional UDP-N-acetylglucosamine diphosphorylase/glucosamine-1-phosphate N-acetyltransferase GlmU [Actinomycetota bacterium]
MTGLAVVVLAAGEGKRMKSSLPKVLHRVAGRSLLGHVLAALQGLDASRTVVVASARKDEIAETVGAEGFKGSLEFVVQDPPRGTGDAARLALEALGDFDGSVLIVPGDTPLLSHDTLAALMDEHTTTQAMATVLTARVGDPAGYGRVIRDELGAPARIVEHRDASSDELLVHEVNASVYVFNANRLSELIRKIDTDNDQGEYYLPDVIELVVEAGEGVAAHRTDETEVAGVNSRVQLAQAAEAVRRRTCEYWMLEGVTIVDPATTYIDSAVTIGRDAVIAPFTFLEGSTTIADRAQVGPHSRIVSSEIEEEAVVSYSVVLNSSIGPSASVGPFASLRPGTRLERGAKIGTFVETKKTVVGEDSKANHLAYLGDAHIGRGVNIGAGTITCNWDGQKKNETVIEDEAYISSDTMLVAPVRIGKGAATGAGAVVRSDVPDGDLAVGMPARIIEGKGNRMSHETSDEEETGEN